MLDRMIEDTIDGVVTINVGKKGLTESLINEINLQLRKRGVVKVRMLRNFRKRSKSQKKELACQISSEVGGKLADLKGFVLIFERC